MTDEAPRKGRPKKPDILPPSERVAASRAKRLAKGAVIRQFTLSAEANAALAAIRERDGDKSDTSVIERLLLQAAKK